MTDEQPPRKILTLTKKRVVIVDPLQTNVGYISPEKPRYNPPPKPQQKQKQQPPKKKPKHKRPANPPPDFNPGQVRNPDEMFWAQQEKKKKQVIEVMSWRDKHASKTTIYTADPKVGKFAIFKVLPTKVGAYFIALHDTFEMAQAEVDRLKKKIHQKDKNLEFSLFITEIKTETFYLNRQLTENGVSEVTGT